MNKFLMTIFLKYLNIITFIVYSGTLYGLRYIGLAYIPDYKNLLLYLMFLISVMYIYIYILKRGINILRENIILTIFCMFIIIISSLFYNNNPNVLKSCFLLFGLLMYSIFLSLNYSYKSFINMLFTSQVMVTVGNFLFTLFYPQFGKMIYEGNLVWKGLFGHKNSLAISMAFGIILSYTVYKFSKSKLRKLISIINIVGAFLLLMLSGSMTSLIIVIASYIFYKVYKIFNIKINPVAILLCINIIVYSVVMLGQKYNDLFMRIFNRDLTLTGRVDIWKVIINLIKYKPLVGYGYGGVWNERSSIQQYIWSKTFIGMETTHNGFLEWAFQVGVIGLFLFLIVIFIMGKKIIKIKEKNEMLFLISVQYMVYLLIFYITEVVVSPTGYQLFMLITLNVYLNKECKKIKKYRSKI